ncbi:MAG: carboxypeptidase-like regulatory domain-containing protein [Bryobacteraceae bacterium]
MLATSRPANSQILYGNILGNITDPDRAAVAGAAVTITSIETNLSRTAVSSDAGIYNFPDVIAGDYTVRVVKEGFRTASIDRLTVAINSVSRVDVRLQLGAVTESIVVSGENAGLQADRSDVHSELTVATLENTPVPGGRNYQQLLVTLPGISPPQNSHSIPANPSRALQFNVNGATNTTNNTRIDGASTTNIFIPRLPATYPRWSRLNP